MQKVILGTFCSLYHPKQERRMDLENETLVQSFGGKMSLVGECEAFHQVRAISNGNEYNFSSYPFLTL